MGQILDVERVGENLDILLILGGPRIWRPWLCEDWRYHGNVGLFWNQQLNASRGLHHFRNNGFRNNTVRCSECKFLWQNVYGGQARRAEIDG